MKLFLSLKRTARILCVLAVLAAISLPVAAQTDTLSSAETKTDTLQPLSIKKPHSPKLATWLSVALPGAGQVYNGQWWKVPILAAGVGASIYGFNFNNSYYKKYRDSYVVYFQYTEALAEDPETPYPENAPWEDLVAPGTSVELFTGAQSTRFMDQLRLRKNSYKRNRDLLVIVMAGIYAINIIDANVFGHLYDFEINEDLALSLQPTAMLANEGQSEVGLSLTLRF